MKLEASEGLANFRDFVSIALVGLKMFRFAASQDFSMLIPIEGIDRVNRRQCDTPIRRRLPPLEILRRLARVERHAVGAAGWGSLADEGFRLLDLGELRLSRKSSPELAGRLDLDQSVEVVTADAEKNGCGGKSVKQYAFM